MAVDVDFRFALGIVQDFPNNRVVINLTSYRVLGNCFLRLFPYMGQKMRSCWEIFCREVP